MRNDSRWMTIGLVVIVSFGSAVLAQPPGDVRLAGGIIVPRGNFQLYADEGPTFDLMGTLRFGHANPFGGWFGVSGAFFQDDEQDIDIYFDEILIGGKKVISQYDVSFNAGFQFTPALERSAIRPYVIAGPGLYLFDTKSDVFVNDGGWDDTRPLHTDHNSQVRFGIRAGAGLDLFFGHSWGLGFKYLFDSVIGLHQIEEVGPDNDVILKSKNARFDSIMLEVIVPFATFARIPSHHDSDED